MNSSTQEVQTYVKSNGRDERLNRDIHMMETRHGKVIFVTGPLSKSQFSGGIIAVFRYAAGLQALGWDVSVVPIAPSPSTGWVSRFCHVKIISSSIRTLLKELIILIVSLCAFTVKTLIFRTIEYRKKLKHYLTNFFPILLNLTYRFLSYSTKRAVWISNIKRYISDDAILIATCYETAYTLQACGIQDYLWFMMHDERLFVMDFDDYKSVAELDIEVSIRRSRYLIMNSSWLRERIAREYPEKETWLCLNALEDEFKVGTERRRRNLKKLNILSYAGRGASWKGFAEMYAGVKLAVITRPDITFNWRVYGTSPTPDDQTLDVFYKSLGFISPNQLIAEYLQADVLLSASWYESFPLFPLEGMGLGAAVIATLPGCEDFILHEKNALVISPQNPSDICEALIKLADNEDLRLSLVRNGFKTSRIFDWKSSSVNLDRILKEFQGKRGIVEYVV